MQYSATNRTKFLSPSNQGEDEPRTMKVLGKPKEVSIRKHHRQRELRRQLSHVLCSSVTIDYKVHTNGMQYNIR
jgi:hypothetical protein